MSTAGDEYTTKLPTDAVFAQLSLMQKATQENTAKCLELEARVSAVQAQVESDQATEQELEMKKEALLLTQRSLNGRLAALRAERDRKNEKERNCFERCEAAEQEHREIMEKSRAARKDHSVEALRLMKAGQDITYHYVMELDDKLKEVTSEVDSLKRDVHEICRKAVEEDEKKLTTPETFPDYPHVTKEDCRVAMKIVREISTSLLPSQVSTAMF